MPSGASSGWCEARVPTYGLRCKKCGHEFDKFLTRLLRPSDKVCPECESTEVEAGFGGGFVVRGAESRSDCAPRGGFA